MRNVRHCLLQFFYQQVPDNEFISSTFLQLYSKLDKGLIYFVKYVLSCYTLLETGYILSNLIFQFKHLLIYFVST